jgi:hypothetical protein
VARKKEKEKKKKKDDKISRKNLANVRVIQKNLVYITNLALTAAKEEVPPPSVIPPTPKTPRVQMFFL